MYKMVKKRLILLGIVLYFVVDSIILLLSKTIDFLFSHIEAPYVLPLFFKLILYTTLAILLFYKIFTVQTIKLWVLVLAIISRFVPSSSLSNYSETQLYYYLSIGNFLNYAFFFVVTIISYIILSRAAIDTNTTYGHNE